MTILWFKMLTSICNKRHWNIERKLLLFEKLRGVVMVKINILIKPQKLYVLLIREQFLKTGLMNCNFSVSSCDFDFITLLN